MFIIALISAYQTDVVDKILDHLKMRIPPRSPPTIKPRDQSPSFEVDHDSSGFFPDPIFSYDA
jgi:hypothetical protein